MRTNSRSPVARAAQVAHGQHGVLAVSQLLDAGVSRDAIKRWSAKGLLHREYRGVYRLGHRAPSLEAHYIAAVLASGEGAALSGFAAAHLLHLTKGAPPAPEVLTPADRSIRGVITHRARSLDRRDVTRYRGIPITTPARTIADLAARIPLDDLAALCHEAEIRHHLTATNMEDVLARRPNTPGTARLRAIYRGDVPVLLSRLERRFRAVLRDQRLAFPVTNRPHGAHYVDCRWPDRRLTIELDGFAYHRTRHAWEEDRERERAARRRGDDFRRYTWRDVVEDPGQMIAELHALLPTLGFAASAR